MTFFEVIDPSATLPTVAHVGDAGWDLAANEYTTIMPHSWKLVGTGVKLIEGALDTQVGLVCPRSGLAAKKGVTVLNGPGILDQGFTGEIKVNLINHSDKPFLVEPGDRIAQLVVVPAVIGIGGGVRGANGHGSSGK